MTTSEVLKHVLKSGIALPEIAVSFARILATKPHSADPVLQFGKGNGPFIAINQNADMFSIYQAQHFCCYEV